MRGLWMRVCVLACVLVGVLASSEAQAKDETAALAESVDGPTTATTPTATAPAQALCPTNKTALERWRRIVIDPGHGGINEGALGFGNMYEKHLTMAVAQHLADRISACFPDTLVVLTRTDDTDVSLQARAEIANRLNADLLLSLHFNSATNQEASGHETFWLADTRPVIPEGPLPLTMWAALADLPAQSQKRLAAASLSSMVARHLHDAIPTELPKSFNRGIKRANFTVLRHANVPALVIEMGFLSHVDEGRNLIVPDFQARWASAILAALITSDTAPAPAAPDLALALPVPSHIQ